MGGRVILRVKVMDPLATVVLSDATTEHRLQHARFVCKLNTRCVHVILLVKNQSSKSALAPL